MDGVSGQFIVDHVGQVRYVKPTSRQLRGDHDT